MILDREQLESLKRQIEEEYKLDMAAIERLQRRFMIPSTGSSSSSSNRDTGSNGRSLSSASVSSLPSYMAPSASSEPATESAPIVELPQERQPDELTGTLRAMFSGQRR
jgi:guanyl-specific ribonuclease Sa